MCTLQPQRAKYKTSSYYIIVVCRHQPVGVGLVLSPFNIPKQTNIPSILPNTRSQKLKAQTLLQYSQTDLPSILNGTERDKKISYVLFCPV